MAKISVYDATPIDEEQLSEYLGEPTLDVKYIHEPISLSNLDTDSEIISVFVSSEVTREIIESLPYLKLIVCRSTGFNNIDLDATEEHDIVVTNVPSYGDETVAEYAFGLMLAITRKIIPASKAVISGDINLPELTGFDLHGKTLGIVGAGKIGQKVARIGIGFGMKVMAYDPFPNEHAAEDIGFIYKELDDLLAESDVVSLHAPYTGANYQIINKDTLAKMKKGSVLVNTARGELVETKALIESLASGHLAGAGLDVVEGEKLLDFDQELVFMRKDEQVKQALTQSMELTILQRLPNVILTPHNAFNTVEAVSRINTTTAENINTFLEGKHSNVVKKPKTGTGKLFIIRHGESEWNAKGVWTGTRDVHLTEKGFKQAATVGRAMVDNRIDFAYCSQQIRALETMENIFSASQQFDVPYERAEELNERDYGDYTGKNKQEMKEFLGDEAYYQLRRGWNYPVPNGETLRDVYARAVPFYRQHIVPKLMAGKNVMIVSHGNAIRSLIKYIESISNDDIADIEMIFNKIITYEVDESGRSLTRHDETVKTEEPPVSKV